MTVVVTYTFEPAILFPILVSAPMRLRVGPTTALQPRHDRAERRRLQAMLDRDPDVDSDLRLRTILPQIVDSIRHTKHRQSSERICL
jgi:hypothetical protein